MSTRHAVAAPPTVNVRSQVARRHREREYTARLALDDRTRREAFSLRYESYLDAGFIAPNASRLFSDRFDEQPTSSVIVVYAEGRPVASVRTCFLSRAAGNSSPARATFPGAVERLLDAAAPSRRNLEGAEITRLVRSPAAANDQGLVFLLFRLSGRLVLNNDVQVILSCVRQNHTPFYRRLRFYPETELRPYPGLNCPMQMLACSRADYDDVRAGFPIMDPEAAGSGAWAGFLSGELVSVPLTQQAG